MPTKRDPRIRKAAQARVANPHLSLMEAIQIGGFQYHDNTKGAVYVKYCDNFNDEGVNDFH